MQGFGKTRDIPRDGKEREELRFDMNVELVPDLFGEYTF